MAKLGKTIECNMAEIVSAYAFAPIGGGGVTRSGLGF